MKRNAAIFCILILMSADLALGQGCVMCKTSLTSQAAGLIQSLQIGILILLVPPVAIMSMILLVVFRRDRSDGPGGGDDSTG